MYCFIRLVHSVLCQIFSISAVGQTGVLRETIWINEIEEEKKKEKKKNLIIISK